MAEDGDLTGGQIAGGLLDGQEEAVKAAGEGMLRQAKPMTRFILKRISGQPALVFNAAEVASAPNKTRAAFGVLGGLVGGAAGGALGTAARGVNAPIGAALGSTFGENVANRSTTSTPPTSTAAWRPRSSGWPTAGADCRASADARV